MIVPVYEYRCAACGHAFSKFFRSVRATDDASCPACGAPNAARTLSAFAYHQSLKMKVESLDPKYEKEVEWADRQSKASDPINKLNLPMTTGNDE